MSGQGSIFNLPGLFWQPPTAPWRWPRIGGVQRWPQPHQVGVKHTLPLHHIISGTTHVKTISPDEESARNCGMNWAPAFFAPKNCKKYKCQSFFVVVCCRCYLLYWTWLIVIHISIHLYIYFYARFIQKPQVWFYILILYSSAVCVKKPLQYQL